MRLALIVHGLPPEQRTGVETHVDALATALVRAGAHVCVLAARRRRDLPHLALRRELRAGFSIDWLNLAEAPRDVLEEADPPGVSALVGEWLARECPEVVHVHHLRGLGWGVLQAVRARGLPLLFTAHDDYALCHRVTRLRPDLARCELEPTAELCARCDRAAAHLHGRAELGDWHMGVLPGQLEPAAQAELEQLLAGRGEPAQRAASVDLRARADALRAQALQCVDLVFAPTRRLAAALVQGGLPEQRVRLQPYGIDVAALRAPRPARPDGSALRVGYFGGLSKHKGAHVLVEACAGLRDVELSLHGDSSDRPYVEGLRARCRELGVRWQGAYAAGELAERMAAVDMVCVPSLWIENAPFVIREAFAAGRPVLASRLGALPESVRDGVDGRLVAAGDAGAWRAAIAALAADRGALATLERGVRVPRRLDDQVDELLDAYALACEREGAPAAHLPAHLAAFQARRAALAAEPFEDLHARVLRGVAELRGALGLTRSLPAQPAPELARARDLLRDQRAALAWRQAGARAARAARTDLEAEAHWLRGLLEQREAQLALERAQSEALRHAGALERDWLREVAGALERERDWLRALLAGLERERGEHGALRAHERWLTAQAERLLAALEEQPDARAETAPAQFARALEGAPERAVRLLDELNWRRAEMQQALGEGNPLLRAVLAPSPLGRRLESWRGSQRERRA